MALKILKRSATPHDAQWLWEIYVDLLKEPIEQQWGWDQGNQARFFNREFDINRYQIILLNKRRSGAYYVNEYEDYLHLRMLLVLQEFQHQGIGKHVIGELKKQASLSQRDIRLSVIKSNPVADFYLKLGFVIKDEDDGCFGLTWSSVKT
ncbi:MAG: GNAT family N-acetyltransferase [Arenicella sp.]